MDDMSCKPILAIFLGIFPERDPAWKFCKVALKYIDQIYRERENFVKLHSNISILVLTEPLLG